MSEPSVKLDAFDLKLLAQLQNSSSLSQRDLAERIGLSQNACCRRLQRLTTEGFVKGTSSHINLAALGVDLTVLVMIRTRHHSNEWADRFRKSRREAAWIFTASAASGIT